MMKAMLTQVLMMRGDLRHPGWMYFKAILLLLVGLLASGILLAERPSLRTAVLLGIAVWGFCRAYYFCFYVIEHYIDPQFRFAGLIAFVRYALWRRRKNRDEVQDDSQTQIR